ncbi:MAG: response regulator [Actinobacteria bacterium]|nr:response regulator [Actinomycetota bacterium]
MPKTVLIVEDVEDISNILSMRLEMYGYEYILAQNGREGLAKMRENKPDLVLLDIRMPGLTGYDLLNAVSTDDEIRHIPVIMCTASAGAEAEEKCIELGAKYFITKPFDHRYLKTCIESCIGLPDGE